MCVFKSVCVCLSVCVLCVSCVTYSGLSDSAHRSSTSTINLPTHTPSLSHTHTTYLGAAVRSLGGVVMEQRLEHGEDGGDPDTGREENHRSVCVCVCLGKCVCVSKCV